MTYSNRGYNGLTLFISCHDNIVFNYIIGNIVVIIVTNPMFIPLWVHEKFTVEFTMSNFDDV